MKRQLSHGFAALGLAPPEDTAKKLETYAQMLLEQNRVMNLTAITDPTQVAALHFLDSAALLRFHNMEFSTLIDVGTGAGFPGMVLKLLQPSVSLTLLDSLEKRLDWLGQVCATLSLTDVARVHARAEEQAQKPGFRDSFDFAVARAVADLRVLCELCLPYVKVGGRFLAMKAADCDGECTAALPAIHQLGGRALPSEDYMIPGTDIRRRIIVVEKVSPTPNGYPRRWAKLRKAPL
ncbi:MAG: 16S rRNA (guanine(527)-N(7))-methyltransferase RsmG [Intestinimonas sp.]|jgi:16S rRNA (guanine527-N7)-methyltransferase|nr:16S rRNA (guanine(527)-N(7))-methyltransferase RsmG [Intestinimonas sp.]